jgi:hypothetical protein
MTFSEAAVQWEFRDALQPHLQRATVVARRAALAGITNLEASQSLTVHEDLLGAPGALERLKAIDVQILALWPTARVSKVVYVLVM